MVSLSTGTHLGPYEIVGLLGAGGMGEVYRARDPRLGREVAVKVLPSEVATDPARLSLFEREARAVAALNHPNILTVHDVGTHDGTPYVVTELLEGETLRELVSRRSPTAPQILGYALQAARGLEAAHAKGIVHRDLKPENLFLTTDGRVKVLDFGLAKLVRSGAEITSAVSTAVQSTPPGQVAGTVFYMSPEQARAQPVDARSDVFSFGVVLYELLAGRHPFRKDTVAGTLTAIVEETPPDLESLGRAVPPAAGGIVRRCLQKAREDRYGSGHDVAMVLEAVLAAPSGPAALREVEERSPYPGLSSFTEKDASVFFGREKEIEDLWGRIRNRSLLAVIGPSGVGKTSFVRAGVVASRPGGWAALVCTPGTAPMANVGRVLAPELAGDPEALQELPRFEDPEVAFALLGRWSKAHGEALLIVDQLEELFILNPLEVQERFAGLLGRLASHGDIHVLLSLRDDFLMRCHDHEPLFPVFTELTPLGALSRKALERALQEPAKKLGYNFEDPTLVDEMVQAVEGARAALPLLAFAVSRLWEKRDRETKVLTRAAYEEIGGVAGALAQHAEATMDRIGSAQHGIVRAIFRHLVTAQGTRAVMDRDELLSAFPDRDSAEGVLNRLVDARLLTSYEVGGEAGEPSHRRIEVAHESLLKAWPRLVRWRTQDEDGAQLRDQLKQAAHLWDEKGRSPDLLWSGTALREYELWRERYAGQLTALEEEYSRAMVERARRRRRLRQGVVATVIVGLAAVAVAIGISRQQVAASRDAARAEAQRAEASKLLALAQLQLEDDPTEALAFTIASLELADTPVARQFAVRSLSQGPPVVEARSPAPDMRMPAFSPDGRWLAVAGHGNEVHLWNEGGGAPRVLPGHDVTPRGSNVARWTVDGLLVTGHPALGRFVHVWSGTGERLGTINFGEPSWWQLGLDDLLLVETPDEEGKEPRSVRLRSWRLPDGDAAELGRVDVTAPGLRGSFFDPRGDGWYYLTERAVYRRPLPLRGGGIGELVSRHASPPFFGLPPSRPDRVIIRAEAEPTQVWSFSSSGPPRIDWVPRPTSAPVYVRPGLSGRWVADRPAPEQRARLWDRGALPGARPRELRRHLSWYAAGFALHPSGDWYVATTAALQRLTFWPLRHGRPGVVDGYQSIRHPLAFGPDGSWLATTWKEPVVRVWALPPHDESEVRNLTLSDVHSLLCGLAADSTGRFLFVTGNAGRAFVVPLDGSPVRALRGFGEDALLERGAISPKGRLLATASSMATDPSVLRVWRVESGEERRYALPEGAPDRGDASAVAPAYVGGVSDLHFVDEETLFTAGEGGLRRWRLPEGTSELVAAAEPGGMMSMAMSADGRVALTLTHLIADWDTCRPAVLIDVADGASRTLDTFGDCVRSLALDPAGAVAATGDRDGIIRVGRIEAEPHLLLGHEGETTNLAISPDLRWLASAGEDNTLRLWPMPDLDKPALHTQPHDELVAKLKSLTNLRAVRDPDASTGWTVEAGPFPGWKEVPEW